MAIHEVNDGQPTRYDLRQRVRDAHAPNDPPHDPRVIAATGEPFWRAEAVDIRDVEQDTYQRLLAVSRVRRIVRDGWKPLKAGIMQFSKRRDGTLYTLDGQHRVAALQQIGDPRLYVQMAAVWHGLTRAQEAEVFGEPQSADNRKPVGSWDIHRARQEYDEAAVELELAAQSAGFALSGRRTAGHIGAVGHLYDMHKRYGIDVVTVALQTIAAAWGNDIIAEGPLIGGTCQFMAMFPDANLNSLVQQLRRKTVEQWLREADADGKAASKALGVSLSSKFDRVAWAMHADHNYRKRSGKLPDFPEALKAHRRWVKSQAARAWRREGNDGNTAS